MFRKHPEFVSLSMLDHCLCALTNNLVVVQKSTEHCDANILAGAHQWVWHSRSSNCKRGEEEVGGGVG